MMKNLRPSIYFILLNLLAFQGNGFEFRGYSTLQFASQGRGTTTQKNLLSYSEMTNINRINLIEQTSKGVFELGLELNQLHEWNDSQSTSPYQNTGSPYRVTNENQILINRKKTQKERYLLLGQVDRLSFDWELPKANIILGRQQFAFGTSKITSPLDPFLPFGPVAINTEERTGIDGIRLKRQIGEMSEWGLGLIFGESFEQKKSAAFAHLKLINEKIEVELLTSYILEAQMVGMGFLKSLGGTNTWLEISHTKPKNEEAYLRSTLGLEYQWNQDLYTIFEYHLNGAGTSDEVQYLLNVNKFAYTSKAVYLLAENYFYTTLAYQLNPLTNVQLGHTFNLNDFCQLITVTGVRSLGDNSQLELGLFQGLGPRGDQHLSLSSEFGRYGTQFFTKLKAFY